MGGVYHLWLADALEGAGLTVIRYEGWEYRAKSSGGYADASRPWGVMLHHTAGNGDAESDSWYQCYGADAAPISNATIDRNGDVWLLAAGPTNTNGSGADVHWSKGSVPADSMNSYAFGIEMCNNGVGGEYPEAQINAAFTVANTVNAHMGNQPTDVALHITWAPDRKIDPARYDAVLGPWQPHGTNSSGSWSLDDVRAECARRSGTAPTPPSEDDLMITLFQCSDADAAFLGASSSGVAVHVSWATAGMAERYRGIPTVVQQDVSVAQLQSMICLGPLPAGDSRHQWTGAEFAAVVS